MDFEKLNKWLSVIASLGVLVGILLVAFELRQNTVALQAQTRSEIAIRSEESALRASENIPMLEAQIKDSEGEDLTDIESMILNASIATSFRRWENSHYQYRQGLYSEVEFAGELNRWRRVLQQPSRISWWNARGDEFSNEFAELINGLVNQ